ncbi:MAG: hypothetical protein J7L15_07765 [Clostridiales bacterium]|nr:hypothetical protein [Clostridiales bacterium]
MTKEESNIDKQKYTRKISIPVYEPKNKKPNLSDIFDTTKRDILCKEIDNDPELRGDDNKELRKFLKSAAERHVVFNFSKIADYYSHLPFKYKTFFEKSGLVIIDYDNAIRNSFVSYEKKIEKTRLEYVEESLTIEMQETRINKLKVKQLEEEMNYLKDKETTQTLESSDDIW